MAPLNIQPKEVDDPDLEKSKLLDAVGSWKAVVLSSFFDRDMVSD